jgi:type IV secretion system protein VirB9
MKRMALILAVSALCAAGFISCRTMDFDRETVDAGPAGTPGEKKDTASDPAADAARSENAEVQEYLKEVDIPKTVVYVEKPVYQPAAEPRETPAPGKSAVQKSTESAVKMPDSYVHGTMWYDYSDDFVYEIYTQPYRTTDLVLEPGEQVIEMPFMSENQVWVLGAGVSKERGQDVQHFFIKPVLTGLVTSMIIITDRRVYRLLLKSYKDAYMTIVKFKYPDAFPWTVKTDGAAAGINSLKKTTSAGGVNPEYLSFDYRMRYSLFRKPLWCPTLVYDDGAKTYIRMDETVLHLASPVLFDKNSSIIDYWVSGSLIVINQLIDKVTLRYGKQKVVIEKKSYKEEKRPDPEAVAKKAGIVSDKPAPASDEENYITSKGMVIGTSQAEEQRLLNVRNQHPVDPAEEDKKIQAAADAAARKALEGAALIPSQQPAASASVQR